jgi:predicted small integral membrane protein
VEAMLAIRLVKTVMVASLALFALLTAYNNVVDYGSNYAFVRHTSPWTRPFPTTH